MSGVVFWLAVSVVALVLALLAYWVADFVRWRKVLEESEEL